MKKLMTIVLISAVQAGGLFAQQTTADKAVHFRTVDVYVDSKTKPLAAYQLELSIKRGDAKIVGVEGGEHPAFKEAPFYDPKAIQQERVIIAAFNTGSADTLPKGKTRVATIHVQITGDLRPEYAIKLAATATVDGKKIPSEATFEERKNE
jgi:hypothetical protein